MSGPERPEVTFLPLYALEALADATPAHTPLLGPLMAGTWGILAGSPGSGKSMLALGIAYALAQGTDLGPWEHGLGDKGYNAGIIDAEMSMRSIIERGRVFAEPDDWPGVWFNTQELMTRAGLGPFVISDPGWQAWLKEKAKNWKLVVIDNIAFTLDPVQPGALYSPETWNQVVPLLNWARAEGKCLLFIDHTNKEGKVSGSLQKQRGADFVVLLEPEDAESFEHLAFTMKLDKARHLVPESLRVAHRMSLAAGEWKHERRRTLREEIREMLADGASVNEIADELQIHRNTVRKHMSR